ncbi:MAG: hypothetical protein GXO40_00970 [Epsilonproteobacteria bacterium]|nr:hypothetical protein [Campylobacterota bacterium]
MRRIALVAILLFVGCSSNVELNKDVKQTNKDFKLLSNYHVTKGSLHKLGNNYIFLALGEDGILRFNKIDAKYDLLQSKKIPIVMSIQKIKVIGDKIYVLGYSQTANRPIFVTLDKDGNILSQKLVAHRYNTPRDFIVQKDGSVVLVLNRYSKDTLSDIVIYKDNKEHIFATKYAEQATKIIPYNNGYLLVGDVSQTTQNVFVAYLDQNFHTKWVRDFDFGLEESIKGVTIKDGIITLDIISQNYTGMEEYYVVKLDKNGHIITKSKKFNIENYPLKFQG